MKTNKGFTLIELLAVIVILAIILLIAVPVVLGIIESSRKEAFKNSVSFMFDNMQTNNVQEKLKSETGQYEVVIKNGEQISTNKLSINGKVPDVSYSYVAENGETIFIASDGNIVVEKSFESPEITIVSEDPATYDIVARYRELRNQTSYKFECGRDVVDLRDGEVYKTIQIGDQCWFERDLAYDCSLETYNNVEDVAEPAWTGTNSCGNQGSGYEGMLYQWPVAMNGSTTEQSQGLCPLGFHIPTDTEWTALTDLLVTTPGQKLKAETPVWNGDNEVGFNALPGGFRGSNGKLYDVNLVGYWWTSTPDSSTHTWRRRLETASTDILSTVNSNGYGFSVRCIETK